MAESKKDNRWGIGIIILNVSFVVFILACVLYASLQDFDLVERDYYARGLAYQDQIDKINNTRALPIQPTIQFVQSENEIHLSFPSTSTSDVIKGSLRLFRPSNSRWDGTIPLELDSSGMQIIPTEQLIKGKWKAILDWTIDNKPYYMEELLFIE